MQSALVQNKVLNEEECIKFLTDNGYIVIPPKKLKATSVKGPPTLVDFFYSKLQFYNRDRNIQYSKSSKRDLRMARMFIKSREEVVCNKKIALQECSMIVDCVISYEHLFKFTEPLHSFDYFGTDNMKWVIDKAIGIINRENEAVNKQELHVFLEELNSVQEKEAIASVGIRIAELKVAIGGIKDDEE